MPLSPVIFHLLGLCDTLIKYDCCALQQQISFGDAVKLRSIGSYHTVLMARWNNSKARRVTLCMCVCVCGFFSQLCFLLLTAEARRWQIASCLQSPKSLLQTDLSVSNSPIQPAVANNCIYDQRSSRNSSVSLNGPTSPVKKKGCWFNRRKSPV